MTTHANGAALVSVFEAENAQQHTPVLALYCCPDSVYLKILFLDEETT